MDAEWRSGLPGPLRKWGTLINIKVYGIPLFGKPTLAFFIPSISAAVEPKLETAIPRRTTLLEGGTDVV